MKKIGKSKILFIILAIVLAIIMVSSTIVYNVLNGRDETYSTANLEKGEQILVDYTRTKEGHVTNDGNFQVEGVSDGYCMHKGNSLPQAGKLEKQKSLYDWYQSEIYDGMKWLMDNMIVCYSCTDPDQMTFYKKNIDSIIHEFDEYKQCSVESLTPNQLFDVQQCLIWNYNNGAKYTKQSFKDAKYGNNGNPNQWAMYDAMSKKALTYKENGYKSNGLYNIVVSKENNFKISTDGKIGPFKLDNPYNTINKITVSGITGQYSIVDATGNVIPEYNKYNGNFYIKINGNFAENSTYDISGKVSIKYFTTTATFYWDGNDRAQPVTTVNRNPLDSSVTFDLTKNGIPDLALKKMITAVDGEVVDENTRSLEIDSIGLLIGAGNTAVYKMRKKPVEVKVGNVVTYKIQIFNESKEVDGYAKEITDYIPEGMIYVDTTKNQENGWKLYDKNGNEIKSREITELEKVVYIKTEKLANTKIDKLTNQNSLSENSKYVEVELKVKNDAEGVLTNLSEITKYGFFNAKNQFVEANQVRVDRDSVQNNLNLPDDRSSYWGSQYTSLQSEPAIYVGQEDDDDFEKVIVNKTVDLALKKTIIKVENGDKTNSTNYNRFSEQEISLEPLMDNSEETTTAKYYMNKQTVDVTQGDYVTYRIYVFNEGNTSAGAAEIKDCFLSDNLEFDKNDELNKRFGWSATTSNGITTAKTTYLDGKLMEGYNKGEQLKSQYVDIRLKVKDNAETNLRLTNIAHISKYQTPKNGTITTIEKDIDSESNNVNLPYYKNKWSGYTLDTTGDFKDVDNDRWYAYIGQEDDDDYESVIVNKKPEFDLALRKFITHVNNGEVTINRKPEPAYSYLMQNGTANYYHTKDAVEVENGDIVTYTIRVYNEGDLAGKATTVTDFLPEGLEYCSSDDDNVKYGWSTGTINGKNYITTNYLVNQNAIPACTSEKQFLNSGYAELKVKLKVNVADTSKGQYLTNIAEISSDEAYDSNSNVVTVNDRDSIPTVKENSNLGTNLVNTFYNNKVTNGNPITSVDNGVSKKYYEGQNNNDNGKEDDNDFDTIYVKPRTRFDINLLKVSKEDIDKDTPTALNGAIFELTELNSEDYKTQIGKTQTITTTNELMQIVQRENCKIGEKYLFKLEETTPPDGFSKIINVPIYISVRFDEDGGINGNNVNLEYFDDMNIDEYCKLKIDQNNKSITIIIANEPKKFDLALRKFITGINNNEVNSRNPELNIASFMTLIQSGTLGYYHTKEAMEVKCNDIVTYTIRVYNEGQVKGYATEITDHLPRGLEFIDSQVNKDNGWSAIKNSDGTTTVKTNKLNKTLLEKCDIITDIENGKSRTWYADVQIQCKVIANQTDSIQYLTNRAEITDDKAVSISKDNIETELDLEDDDSTPKYVKKSDTLEETIKQEDALKYDPNISYSWDMFYKGYEDDDDKETIYINPIKDIEFKINKVDNISKASIAGAKFKIEPNGDMPEITSVVDSNENAVSKNADNTYTIPKGGVTVIIKGVDVNKTYTYLVTEETAPDGYDMGDFRSLVIAITPKIEETNSELAVLQYIEHVKQSNVIVPKLKMIQHTTGIPGIATLSNENNIEITIENQNTDTFDLALRKYITNVYSENKNKNENYSRMPEFDMRSVMALHQYGTAWYYHDKNAINVETGDIVTYTIRVYNESKIKGRVTEITDYLPAGLEFCSSEVDGIDYKWNVTKNNDGTTILKTNYLKNTELCENQIMQSIVENPANNWYAEVKVKCKVVAEKNKEVQYLTNRAEITAHVDERGNKYGKCYEGNITNYIPNNNDRDSTPDTIQNNLKLDSYYNENVLGGNFKLSDNFKYYPGMQDDDDFETVMLDNVTNFKLNVIKENVTNNAELTDAINFTVQEIDNKEKILSTNTVSITGNGELLSKTNIPTNQEYRYKITEELPEELQGKYRISTKEVVIKITTDKDGKVSVETEKWNGTTASAYSRKYFNAFVNGETVSLEFKNEPISKYSVVIEKVDENGETIEGNKAIFKVDNKNEVETNAIGIATVVNGKEFESINDLYRITEEKAPTGYGKFDGTIYLTVKSKIENGNYAIDRENSNVQITQIEDGRLAIKEIELNTMKNGIGYFIEEEGNIPIIKIKVENPETHGKYSIEAIKVDENGNKIEENPATFVVNSEVKPTSDNGIVTVVKDKNISIISQNDLYDITETTAPKGYVAFDGRVKLNMVFKEDTNTNEYVIDKDRSQVTIIETGKETVTNTLAYFDGLNGKFDDGLSSTVYIDETTDVSVVKVLVKNNPEGKYNLRIEKIDEEGNAITNNVAQFNYKCNEDRKKSIRTDFDTGIAKIVEEKAITSVAQRDNFEITETQAPIGYTRFEGIINVTAVSKFENGKYMLDINNTRVTVTKSIQEEQEPQDIQLGDIIDGVGFYIEEGDIPTIVIQVKNPKKTGKFGVKLIKVDEMGAPVTNNEATFEINGTSKQTNNQGELEIAENVNITEAVQNFNYKIVEKNAPDGFTLFDKPINLSIWTKEETDKYTINPKSSVMAVGNVNNQYFDYIDDLNGKFKDGKLVTAYVDKNGDYPVIVIKVKNKREGKYRVELEKVDDKGNLITTQDISFNITKPSEMETLDKPINIKTDEQGKIVIENERKITSEEQEDKYTITEAYAPAKYAKFNGRIELITKTILNNGVYQLDTRNTVLKVITRTNGQDVEKEVPVTLKPQNGYTFIDGIAYTISGAENPMSTPTIKIRVENPVIQGRYSVKLIKVDDNGNAIESNKAKFTVNDTQIPTDPHGVLEVVRNKEFTENNQRDDYSIQEIEAPDGYTLYPNEISLSVFSKNENNTYVINEEVSVLKIENEGEYTLDSLDGNFTNNKNVTAYIDRTSDIPVIIIKVKNTLKGKYNIELVKVDKNGNEVKDNQATFNVITPSLEADTNNSRATDFGGILQIENGREILSDTQSDKYTITEEKEPDGFIKFEGTIEVNVKTKKENGQYVLDQNNTTVSVTRSVPGGQATQFIKVNSMPKEVGFYIEDGEVPTIKIKVQNPPIEGKYALKLIKVDGEGNVIKNNKATFTVKQGNNVTNTKQTDDSGELVIENEKSITAKNQQDYYYIQEINAPNGYALYPNLMTLQVNAKQEGNKYTIDKDVMCLDVKGVGLIPMSSKLGEFKNANVAWFVDDQSNIPTITIHVKNILQGKYNLELIKVDDREKENEIKNNPAKFKVITPATPIGAINNVISTDENGHLKIANERVITNASQEDAYTISEEQAPEGYKKFDGKIEVLPKFKIESGKLVLDKLNTTVSVTRNGQATQFIQVNSMPKEVGFYIKDVKVEDGEVKDGKVPTIQIKVQNPPIEGKYAIKLIKVDEDGNKIENNSATFKIIKENKTTQDSQDNQADNKENSEVYTSKGEVYITSKDGVKIENANQHDIYTITEEEAPNGYIKFKGNITLHIFAKKQGDSYAINKNASVLDAGADGVYGFNNLNEEFAEGKMVTGCIDDKEGIPTIIIKVKNTPITGKFDLKIKKVNSINKNQNVAGVVFSGLDYNKNPIQLNPTDENGIAIVDENVTINKEGKKFTYKLKEESVPENYTKLHDYEIMVKVSTKLSDDKESYVVENVIVEPKLKDNSQDGSQFTKQEKEMLTEGLGYIEEDGIITVTVPNEPTTNYSFKVNKIDKEINNVFVENARFTIDGPNGNIQTDKVLKDAEESIGKFLDEQNNVRINQTYTYMLTETYAPIPYENVFKIGDKTLQIKVDIVIDENGNVNQNKSKASLVVPEGINISGGENAKAYTKAYECLNLNESNGLVFDGNNVTLNIKNPQMKVDYELELFKHQLNNESKGIEGAKFKVKRKQNGDDDYEVLYDIDNPLLSSDIESVLIDERKQVSIDNTYYYDIEEIGVPNDNYMFGKVKGATIKVKISENAEVEAEIISVKLTGTNATETYSEDLYGEDIKLEANGDNKFTLKMPNSTWYALELYKRIDKNGENDYETAYGGKFKVYKVTRNGAGNPTATEITPENGTSAPWDSGLIKDANPNSSYEYWIEEIESPDGLVNDFENITVQLILKTGPEGNVLDIGTGGSSLNFLYTNTKGNVPANVKTFLYGKCKINVRNNRVEINLKDSPVVVEPEKYGIQIVKVDKDNPDKVIPGVEFNVLEYAAGATGIQYDADPDEEGIQNPVTNKEGIINISGIEIVEGQTDLFRITEITDLDEYKSLKGNEIDVRVNLQGVTSQDQITEDKITAELIGPTANVYPADYIKINKTASGIIQIIIPNTPNSYQFVLNKKDELGNLITSNEEANGALDGASIYVRNQETGEYLFLNSVLEDGTRSRMINCKANTEYEIRIVETKSKSGYVNILAGYELVLNVVTDENGNVKEVRQGDNEYTRYGIGETPNVHVARLPRDVVMGLIDVRVDWANILVSDEGENEVEKTVRQLVVDIKNPKSYSFRLTKLDTKGNKLDNVVMDATKVVNGVETEYKVSLNNTSTNIEQQIRIAEGEEQVWRIREKAVNTPYYNVLPDNAYIDVKVKCENGEMKVIGYEVFNKNGAPIQITKDTVLVSKEAAKINGEEVIAVAIINPAQYLIDVDKVIEDTEGNYTSLHGASIKVSALTPDRNGETNSAQTNSTNGTDISLHRIVNIEQVHRYRIEEFSTPEGHTNVFEGKFVEFNVHFNSNKKPVVSDIGVYYNNNGQRGALIQANDEIYNYIKIELAEVQIDGVYHIKAYVINPIEYEFEITKVKTDDNKSELPGAEIRVNNELVIKDGLSSYKTVDTIKVNEEKTFWINEINSTGNHYNVLKSIAVKVKVKMILSENGEETLEIVGKELYAMAGTHYQTKLPQSAENVIFKYMTIQSEKNNGRHTIKVIMENPIEYKINLYKVKTDNQTGLYGATLTYNGKEVIKENSSPKYQTHEVSKVGEIKTFDIKELSTAEGYVNILEGDKILRIKATINNNEKLEILSTTIVENVDGEEVETPLAEYESLKNYITVEKSTVNENFAEYESIEIKVQNPREFKFRIAKFKSNGESLLRGAIIKVDGKIVMNGEEAVYEEVNVLDIGESHTITVEEDSTVAGNVNILKGKKLIVTATVLSNENLSIEKRLVTNDEKQTEITDKNILKYFETYGTTTSGNLRTAFINITNPEEYNLKIVKVDKDTKERMNDVKFDVSVFDENNEEIKLKDSNTFEDKDLSGLVTSNVDGEDGIIKIPNILIERTGTFTFKFHETQKYAYVSIPDVVAKVTIENENGNYVVKSIEVEEGENVVNKAETKVTVEEPETIQIEIENERVKGEYDLILNKVDKVTLKKLDGAKFKVSVERDDKESELYKKTDDVTSKEVIIPTEVTVKDGTIVIENIRIEKEESYIIKLQETTTPKKYIDFNDTIKLKVTTKIKDEKYVLDSVELLTENELITKLSDENRIEITVKNEQFDLALRKYIAKVITNEGKENEKVKIPENREPDVNTEGLKGRKSTTAEYKGSKEPISVFKGDTVIYTLRVYNEGDVAGYAEVVTDHLPEYLEFVNDDFNSKFGWILDENDKTLRTVSTRYLSKENDKENNLIKPFNNETGEIDYKEIQIKCKVKSTVPDKTKITNLAEITEFTDEQGNEVTDRDSDGGNLNIPEDSELPGYKDKEITEGKEYIPGQEDDDDFEKIIVEKFDLALRKFITAVTNGDNTRKEITTRIPKFKVDENGNYIYEHTKEPLVVANQNVVEYILRVYNEGTVDGYAKQVKDDIPEGLEFLPNDETNKKYGWIMLDEEEKETNDVNKAKYIVTNYLSKENEKTNGEYLLKAFDKEAYEAGTIKEPDYKEVKVAFKVTLPDTSDEIIINKAQISDDSNSNGDDVEDEDSTPNEWNEGEDDQDIEKVKVQYFDLALRKWVTKAIVIKDGKQEVRETGHKAEDDPEEVVKVDLEKSKLKDVIVKFEYQIRVTNEGQINGIVKEISDYIPEGLKFVPADNPTWVEADGKVTTDELKDTLLKPGESAEVTIVLTWINRENNMGLKVNTAEISKDYNEYGSPDVDSTPNNKVPGEDDIDDAPVMLTVKTGEEILYIGITMTVLLVLACGIVLIKKVNKKTIN